MVEMLSIPLMANPGDTTWVTVFDQRKLTQYGNYDTTAVFPTNGRYQKIRLHYTLGRYTCVPTPTPYYCGSWDYTTQIFAMPAGKDSAEIARVITPYATDWLAQNKKHTYIVEVTDYASILEGSTSMRFHYSGYSWGFTITLKLEFIEGVPPMDALEVKNIYDGYFPYGNSANPIENYLTVKQFSFTAPTSRVFVKNFVSGHGIDNTGCSEFCNKYYRLKINGNIISQKQLWRNDCGLNQVYPQTGTWIYDRSNWCPGAVVWPIYHDLSQLTTANSTFSVDVDMQNYVTSNPSGGYQFGTQLIHYSSPNHSRDVSIEDIVSPTKDANYFRNNPRCSNPIIKIKNTGTDSVKSIVFSYGLKGGTPLTYTWTGALGFLDQTDAVFPPSSAMLSGTVSSVFQVSILSVNNISGDQNTYNNIYTSLTTPVAVFPQNFVIRMTTNNYGYENSWTLYDEYENVIASRSSLNSNTVYLDTLWDLPYGCYRISLDDSGCDGLSWWNNAAQGTGSLRVDYIGVVNTIFLFPTDIGCNFTKYFALIDPNPNMASVNHYALNPNAIAVYPNPAQNSVYLKFDLNRNQTVNYNLQDINGRTLQRKTIHRTAGSNEIIDISQLSNGVYLISFELEDRSVITKKIVIQK